MAREIENEVCEPAPEEILFTAPNNNQKKERVYNT